VILLLSSIICAEIFFADLETDSLNLSWLENFFIFFLILNLFLSFLVSFIIFSFLLFLTHTVLTL
jgi:hypothetical protein